LSATGRQRLAQGMRIAARVIGLAVALFGLMMAIGEGIQSLQTEGFKGFNLEFLQGTLIILSLVIALAGCIISWWRERLAGILLILTFIGLAITGAINRPPNAGGLIFGSPFLVAGVLFLLSRWFSRKTA
jgi:hypothetical protein